MKVKKTTSLNVINLSVCRKMVFLAALTKLIFVFQYSEQMQNGWGPGSLYLDGLISWIMFSLANRWSYIPGGGVETEWGTLTWNFMVYNLKNFTNISPNQLPYIYIYTKTRNSTCWYFIFIKQRLRQCNWPSYKNRYKIYASDVRCNHTKMHACSKARV